MSYCRKSKQPELGIFDISSKESDADGLITELENLLIASSDGDDSSFNSRVFTGNILCNRFFNRHGSQLFSSGERYFSGLIIF